LGIGVVELAAALAEEPPQKGVGGAESSAAAQQVHCSVGVTHHLVDIAVVPSDRFGADGETGCGQIGCDVGEHRFGQRQIVPRGADGVVEGQRLAVVVGVLQQVLGLGQIVVVGLGGVGVDPQGCGSELIGG